MGNISETRSANGTAAGNGIAFMVRGIVASLVAAAVGFAIELVTYKATAAEA